MTQQKWTDTTVRDYEQWRNPMGRVAPREIIINAGDTVLITTRVSPFRGYLAIVNSITPHIEFSAGLAYFRVTILSDKDDETPILTSRYQTGDLRLWTVEVAQEWRRKREVTNANSDI